MKFITQISGVPGSGEGKTLFESGAVSTDLKCAQFFMMLQDKDASLAEAKGFVQIGKMVQQDVDWGEISRVLATFEK